MPPKQLEEDDTIPAHNDVPIEKKSDREHDVGTITDKQSGEIVPGATSDDVKVDISSKEETQPIVELIETEKETTKMNDS